MELEFHRLDLRYEGLRKRSPAREARLLASLAESGQQVPVVVVAGKDEGRHVLVDGYKRVRALVRLRRDAVQAVEWALSEAEALLLERLMRSSDGNGPLEEGWLLAELRDRFAMSVDELARRFDKSTSWVSRRLSLVIDLPGEIQEQVRRGEIVAHSAMKHFVPLARANREQAVLLSAALGPHRPTSRQVATIYAAWMAGSPETQEEILRDPLLFLRAHEAARRPPDPAEQGPAAVLLSDLDALGGMARRGVRHLREGLAKRLLAPERAEVRRALLQARADALQLFTRCHKEVGDARPDDPLRDPAAA
jgi:ParB/RepB/Spo0J family partition protein